ncbi:RNF139 [Acanthosepion pharaonis]|uniref:RNF139 n=1 Tax=Acanthosepion pharaonis TaxID=158019 RepID=A0A812D4P2_ACAPH|nr:RNF139 [Sepia pharaonis]
MEEPEKDLVCRREWSLSFRLWFLFNFADGLYTWALHVLTVLLGISGFLAALVVFCLELNNVLLVYSYLISFGVIFLYQYINKELMELLIYYNSLFVQRDEVALRNIGYFVVLSIGTILLTNIFIHFRRKGLVWTFYWRKYLEPSVYFSSLLIVMFKLTTDITIPHYFIYIHSIYTFSLLALDLFLARREILIFIQETYAYVRQDLSSYGIQIFLENHWLRLHLPQVFRLFWLSRFLCHMFFYANTINSPDYPNHDKVFAALVSEKLPETTLDVWTVISKSLLVRGCDTVIALLGLTSIVSLISHYIGMFVAHFVGTDMDEDRNADRNVGILAAMLFFVLALQTGLTGLEVDARLVRLFRNFCLLSTAIFHFVHSMVHPILMSVSAARNALPNRHLRPLIMCFILILFPSQLLKYLWSHHSASTWLLAVSAFSIEIIVKVLVTLTVYLLFMIDAYRNTAWEALDDYVYYIQSTGNTIEFLFGIFLFCNGAWIMFFESGGTIRAIMMCIHAYFNIWVQAKEGWKVFIRRRTAVNKINSLPAASQKQLDELNDLCAICFEHLYTARVTQCNHFFHGVCLRKWLYIQDKCPMCHNSIYKNDDANVAVLNDQQAAAAD